jgi:hypothetical protein
MQFSPDMIGYSRRFPQDVKSDERGWTRIFLTAESAKSAEKGEEILTWLRQNQRLDMKTLTQRGKDAKE